MANVHPQNQPPHEDNPLTAMLISLSGSGGPAHETGPPGANELSVRAGHEPDRFQVRSILYVPAAVVVVLVLAYLLVTWLFAMAMNSQEAELARAKQRHPNAGADWNERVRQVSSIDPKPLPGDQPAGTAQPRREGLYQTRNKAGDPADDPEHYRSKLADPEGNNPVDVRPEDLRPENYVGHYFDPVRGEKLLAKYGWADEGKKIARVPIDEAIRMAAAGKLQLPVRKDPVKLPETTVGRARQSNSGRGGQPPAGPTPTTPSPHKGGDHKDDKHPEKK